MKNAILIVICAFPGVITLIIIMALYGRVNRSMELKSNFSSAMEKTVENAMSGQDYKIRNEEEFVAEFMETLVYTIDAKSEMQVDIFQCDKEKGILSSAGTIFYEHPNGEAGSIESQRTVIYNRTKEEIPVETYTVEFYIDGECYKTFDVCKNSVIIPPKQPEMEGRNFKGWINVDGTEIDFNRPITENIRCYANLQ